MSLYLEATIKIWHVVSDHHVQADIRCGYSQFIRYSIIAADSDWAYLVFSAQPIEYMTQLPINICVTK